MNKLYVKIGHFFLLLLTVIICVMYAKIRHVRQNRTLHLVDLKYGRIYQPNMAAPMGS